MAGPSTSMKPVRRRSVDSPAAVVAAVASNAGRFVSGSTAFQIKTRGAASKLSLLPFAPALKGPRSGLDGHRLGSFGNHAVQRFAQVGKRDRPAQQETLDFVAAHLFHDFHLFGRLHTFHDYQLADAMGERDHALDER